MRGDIPIIVHGSCLWIAACEANIEPFALKTGLIPDLCFDSDVGPGIEMHRRINKSNLFQRRERHINRYFAGHTICSFYRNRSRIYFKSTRTMGNDFGVNTAAFSKSRQDFNRPPSLGPAGKQNERHFVNLSGFIQ